MENTDLTPAAPSPATQPVLDVNGFNPDDYDWLPIARHKRHDGWTPEKQREFIEALADTGSVTMAARAVKMTPQSCYRLRRLPEAQRFARAWDMAIAEASKQLLDIAFDRVLNGEENPIFSKDGMHVGTRRRYSDRMMMFLLRAYNPERFALPGPVAVPMPAPAGDPALSQTLDALEPLIPPDVHLRLPPGEIKFLMEADAFNQSEEERFEREYPEAYAREQEKLLKKVPSG